MPGRTESTSWRTSLGPGGGDIGIFRARTDQAHLAQQDVPELGQFIQFGIAQEFAKGGDAGIAIGGDFAALVAFVFFVHGAEFEDAEGFAFIPGARTAVEDRPGGVLFEADGDVGKERTEQEQPEAGHQQVDEAAQDVLDGDEHAVVVLQVSGVVCIGHGELISGFGISGFQLFYPHFSWWLIADGS